MTMDIKLFEKGFNFSEFKFLIKTTQFKLRQTIDLFFGGTLLHSIDYLNDATTALKANYLYKIRHYEQDIFVFCNESIIYWKNDEFAIYEPDRSTINNENLFSLIKYIVDTNQVLDKSKELHDLLKFRITESSKLYKDSENIDHDLSAKIKNSVSDDKIQSVSKEDLKNQTIFQQPTWRVEIIGSDVKTYEDFIHRLFCSFQFPNSCFETEKDVLAGLKNLSWLKSNRFAIIFWEEDKIFKGNKALKAQVYETLESDILSHWIDSTDITFNIFKIM